MVSGLLEPSITCNKQLHASAWMICFTTLDKKKRTILEIRGEKNVVPRVISCSITSDQHWARSDLRLCPTLIALDRAWYHTWNSFLLAASLEDGSFFFAPGPGSKTGRELNCTSLVLRKSNYHTTIYHHQWSKIELLSLTPLKENCTPKPKSSNLKDFFSRIPWRRSRSKFEHSNRVEFFVNEIGFFLSNVSPCGFVRDLGKERSFPKSLTKPQGETLGKKTYFNIEIWTLRWLNRQRKNGTNESL